jgi:hypothetical protein
MTPEVLAEQMVAKRAARLEKEGARIYPRSNPIASDLGDCNRQLALGILAWSERRPFPPEAVERMENGRNAERVIVRELEDEGWRIVEQQAPFEIRDKGGRLLLRGSMEGKIALEIDGRRRFVPFEVKDTSQFVFARIETEEDLRSGQWTRKWWRQFQAYLVGHSFEWGILILAHRGQRKFIPIRLDYAAAELILQRTEHAIDVVDALRAAEISQLDHELSVLEVPYLDDLKVCRSCDFFQRVCFPPVKHALEGEIVEREDLLDLVAEHQRLEKDAKKYESLHRKLEREAPRGSHVVAGPFLVTGRWEEQSTKPVPAKEAVPAGTKKIWRREIRNTQAECEPEADEEGVA